MSDWDDLSNRPIEFGHDIFFCDPMGREPPPQLEILGKTYIRFMDFIYLPREPEELSEEQVVAVNEIRQRYMDILAERAINLHVRDLVLRLVQYVAPNSVLELGAGYNPIFGHPPEGMNYWIADLNEKAIEAVRKEGLEGFVFKSDGILPLDPGTVDLMVAIFVLQFRFSVAQIATLAQVLTNDGVMVANVYRRSEESRDKLLRLFAFTGFEALILEDPSKLCRGHEYWCLYRDRSSPLLVRVSEFFEENLK